MKTLVVFYSLEGNTRWIAETVAARLQADLLELRPKKEYPSQGFHKYFRGGKSVLFRECPELIPQNTQIDDYQNIVIGTPVWAGSYSPPVRSFLSQNRIQNKKIAFFACHASKSADAAGKCFDGLKKELSGNTFVGKADFVDPLKSAKEENAEKAAQWAAGLNF